MVDIKQAADIAINSTRSLLVPGDQSLRVEEIEFDIKSNAWNVTVSFIDRDSQSLVPAFRPHRIYKVVRVNSHEGNVDSVKMLALP